MKPYRLLTLLTILMGIMVLGPHSALAQVFNLRDTTVTTCTGTLYDTGGPASDYGNDEDSSFTIDVPGSGGITLTFISFDTESGQDSITIYDGPNSASPVLAGPFSGTPAVPFTVNAPGSVVTIRFQSDGATVSSGFQIDWDANITPSVSMSADANPVCPGDLVTFTVTDSSNAGNPDFEWTLNGAPAPGAPAPGDGNAYLYTNSSLANDDTIRVIMTAEAGGCYTQNTDTAEVIMTVNPNVTPMVAVSVSTNPFCPGDPVTFTVIDSSNAGNPDFEWTLNGAPAPGAPAPGATNAYLYTNSSLANDDTVRVIMTAEAGGCYTQNTDTAEVIMVSGGVNPSVSITASSYSVCAGSDVTFTVTDSTNGGSNPDFQWKLNGINVGTNSHLYTNSTLSDNDVIAVIMTSNAACLATITDTDTVVMNINPNPSVIISSVTHVDCFGNSTGLAVASATGGSGAISYLWSNAQANDSATSLAAGNYLVTITDDSTCTDTVSAVITQPLSPIVTDAMNVTNVSSFGGSDGAIGAHISGGTIATDYSYSWNTTPAQVTDSISNLVSRNYVLTVTDDNGCVHIDSAFVDQPALLTGGAIQAQGGGATTTVCDGNNVGKFEQASATTGGTGSNVYTWQTSNNLLTWTSLPLSDSITSFTYNNTITQDIFIRRRVVDAAGDSAFSNVVFVDYIADLNLAVTGLNAAYCENAANVTMTGIPAGGNFIGSAYVTGSSFSPANATAGGVSNMVSYQYTDGNGCLSQLDMMVVVNDTTAINFALNTTYNPTSLPDTLVGIPSGGSFSGIGVVQKNDSVYVFDPSVPPKGVPINVTYTLENGTNCVSRLVKLTTILNNTVTLTGFQPDMTYCVYDAPHPVQVDLGTTLPSAIAVDTFFVRNLTVPSPILVQTETGLPFNSFTFNPSSYGASSGPGVYQIGIKYRYGVERPAPDNDTLYTDVDQIVTIVNTGTPGNGINNVRIVNQANSNGSTGAPFQYCENLTSVSMVGGHPSLGANKIFNSFSITGGSGLTHTNNNDTAFLNPSHPSLVTSGTITYTFTDSASGCFTSVNENYNIDALPVVTLSGIDEINGYCANTGTVYFSGAPYVNPGSVFSSTTLGISPGNDTVSFTADQSSVGTHKVMYTFTHPTTGCTNRDSATFSIDTLPVLSIEIDTPSVVFIPPNPRPTICVSSTSLSMKGLVAGNFISGLGNFSGPGVTDNNNTNSNFNASIAGVQTATGHEIRYYYTDGNGCTDTTRTHIEVNPLPNPAFTVPSEKKYVCVVNDPVEMEPTNALLTNETDFYRLKVGLSTFPLAGGDSVYNPLTQVGSLGPGNTDTIQRTVTNNVTGCAASTTDIIFINPDPVPSITVDSASYCANEGLVTFTFSPSSEGNPGFGNPSPQGDYIIENILTVNRGGGNIDMYNLAAGVNSNQFNTTQVSGGQVTITYTHTDSVTGCRATVQQITPILTLPNLLVDDSAFLPTGVYCYGLSGTVFGGIYQNPNPLLIDTIKGFGTTIINPAPNDSTFTFSTTIPGIPNDQTVDSVITYYYHNTSTGCKNYTNHTVKLRRPPLLDFDLEDQGKDAALCITDLTDVRVTNLLPSILNPGASRQYELNSKQILGGQTFKPSVDSTKIGFNVVQYLYTDQYQCRDSIIDSIQVYATPVASFQDPSLCFEDTVTFLSTSTIHLSTSIDTSIWDFGDGKKDTIFTNMVTHKYLNPGLKNISLTEISTEGCRSQVARPLSFGQPPSADFTWPRVNECGNTIEILNATTLDGGILDSVKYVWDFGDGSAVNTVKDPVHSYGGTNQSYLVQLIANISDCADTIHKVFTLRPDIATFPYFEDFESGKNGWEIEYNYDSDDIDTGAWAFGTPNKPGINGAKSGSNAWVTGLDVDYRNNDTTYVISPCFDFSNLNRPMIRMWLNYDMDPNDGVVLQYTTDTGTAVQWRKLGDTPQNGFPSGIKWYTKDGIAASPGKQTASERNVGWTDTSGGWVEARHRLDELAGEPYVRLRFAIGSGPSNVNDGFAFDDIWIGERTKNVLLETFTNTASLTSASANSDINPIIRNNAVDVLNVQYHTSFPGNDPINKDNQADPSARVLYYGISEVPYAVMDGNQYNQAPFGFEADLVQLRALKDPEFRVQLQTVKNNNQLNIKATINANAVALNKLSHTPDDVTLHLVVIEDSIAVAQLPAGSIQNGETSFLNTLKQMVPTAAGKNYTHRWDNGEVESVEFNVALNAFKGGDSDWKVIAFVQDNDTREVYQAAFNNSNNPTTGMPEHFAGKEGFDFILYPNPASGTVNFLFNGNLESAYDLTLMNQLGAVVSVARLAGGLQQHQLETNQLPEGMYYIILTDAYGNKTTRKLMVAR